jgi:hypothetical protein
VIASPISDSDSKGLGSETAAAQSRVSGSLSFHQLGSIGLLWRDGIARAVERLCNVDQFCRNISSIIVFSACRGFTWVARSVNQGSLVST